MYSLQGCIFPHLSILNMLRGGSEWVRYICLALLLDLLLISTGSAIPLRGGYVEKGVADEPITVSELRYSNSHALPEMYSRRKDSIFMEKSLATTGEILVRKIFSAVISQTQFSFEADSPGETGVRKTGAEVESLARRFLRGPGRPRPHIWSLTQQHQGRRAMEGSNATTTPSGDQTQPFYLGPPAPPGLVHNEKQDWNQDYAEPDVHPPSSN